MLSPRLERNWAVLVSRDDQPKDVVNIEGEYAVLSLKPIHTQSESNIMMIFLTKKFPI